MTTIIMSNRRNITVNKQTADSEERIVRLTAWYKGVNFEIMLKPEMEEYLTKTQAAETVSSLIKKGEPAAKQKEFWLRRMDTWVAIYHKLIADEDLYVGRESDILINDMIKEAFASPGDMVEMRLSEFEGTKDEKVHYWMWSWVLGVAILIQLGGIDGDDNQNGFVAINGPKSLMMEFGKVVDAEAVKMREQASGGEPNDLD
jgi:hypothetical protein